MRIKLEDLLHTIIDTNTIVYVKAYNKEDDSYFGENFKVKKLLTSKLRHRTIKSTRVSCDITYKINSANSDYQVRGMLDITLEDY